MKLETKFNIGEEVFFLYENEIRKSSVSNIDICIGSNDNIKITYELKLKEKLTCFNLNENKVFKSKEELIETIFNVTLLKDDVTTEKDWREQVCSRYKITETLNNLHSKQRYKKVLKRKDLKAELTHLSPMIYIGDNESHLTKNKEYLIHINSPYVKDITGCEYSVEIDEDKREILSNLFMYITEDFLNKNFKNIDNK